MKLITLEEYRREYYSEGARPTLGTLYRWAKAQRIPAQRVGRKWLVDANRLTPVVPALKTHNPLVARILGVDSGQLNK
jgi:hypothetical protein